jgi:hypothetical protein
MAAQIISKNAFSKEYLSELQNLTAKNQVRSFIAYWLQTSSFVLTIAPTTRTSALMLVVQRCH